MDILNELADKFALTLDSQLCNNSDYLKAMALLHELSEGLPAEKATELDDIAAALTSAAFNAGVRSGLKLGARIAVGLIGSEKRVLTQQPSFGTALLFYGGLKMEENKLYCSHCGALIDEDEDYEEVNGEIVCTDCYEHHTTACDRCESVIWTDDSYGDEYTTLCHHCYENHYTRCSCCDALLHEDDCYHLNGDDYCSDCYHEEVDRSRNIHDYGYKPEPVFYGDDNRFFGIELEIDGAGKDDDNAEQLLKIANATQDRIYIKGDGSLDDGMELVTHPMSLDYHKNFCWEEIMKKAISMGYRSHQTSTCGLHIHVNRDCFGDNRDTQDEVISRILYFVEHHWNEMLKFSRRSEYSMNRWAARYGFEKTGREILDKAKKGGNGRICCRKSHELLNYRVPYVPWNVEAEHLYGNS